MVSWAFRELGTSDFGDLRLTDRLVTICEDVERAANESIPAVARSWADTKAFYRFFDNDSVTDREIIRTHRERVVERASSSDVVLVVQDTTEIDHSKHRGTKGLGYLTCPHARGLMAHNLFCLSGEGVPLGLLGQHVWSRPPEDLGQRETRDQRPISDKESRRWIWGLSMAKRYLSAHPKVVVISDREGDLYELFAKRRPSNIELLVRVRETRRVVDHPARYLGAALDTEPVRMKVRVPVPRADGRPGRIAELSLRWCQLTVHRPANYRGRAGTPAVVSQWFLVAREESPPPGSTPIYWILVTTIPIDSEEIALKLLQWYTYRWRIERFHFVLKSGCGVERHRLETADRLKRMLATFSVVAWRILWLTYASRENPDEACTKVLSPTEWRVLHLATEDASTPFPTTPPSLAVVTRQIAKLGGFLGRKRDGTPGVKVLWKGMRRLADLVRGYHLAKNERQPDSIESYG
jgi:hypothetical protein